MRPQIPSFETLQEADVYLEYVDPEGIEFRYGFRSQSFLKSRDTDHVSYNYISESETPRQFVELVKWFLWELTQTK